MRIYLDNNASTEIHPVVLDAFRAALEEYWGNASSVHAEGQSARMALEAAREEVATAFHAVPRSIVFTSGGSESNNTALQLPAGGHVVCSTIEHPSVLEPLRQMESRGVRVTWIDPDEEGRVDAGAMIGALGPETRLAVLMLANNETGVLQPVAEVAAACRERSIRTHCDAAQAAGRIAVDVRELGVDTMTLAGHKMHAPKGVGALYIREGTTLQSLVRGGAQERRRRAGTESVPLAIAMAKAAGIAAVSAGEGRMGEMRDRFERELLSRIDSCSVNGGGSQRLPNTSNILFRGRDGESLVIGLDLEGVAASTGSACSSGRVEPSHVLLAMGHSLDDARSSVRFSLSILTTDAGIDAALRIVTRVAARHERLTTGTG